MPTFTMAEFTASAQSRGLKCREIRTGTAVTAALAIHAWRHADYAGAVGAGLMTVMSLLTGALYAFLAGSIAARIKEHHD